MGRRLRLLLAAGLADQRAHAVLGEQLEQHAVRHAAIDDGNALDAGELSWEGKPPSYLEFFKKPAAQYRNSLEVYVQCCRDDVVMGLQVALMFPDCPLRAVTSRDRDCAVDLMKLVGEFYEGVPPAEPKHESLKYCFKCCKSIMVMRYTESEVNHLKLRPVDTNGIHLRFR